MNIHSAVGVQAVSRRYLTTTRDYIRKNGMIIPLPDRPRRVSSPAMRFLTLVFAAGCGSSPVTFDASPPPIDSSPPPPPVDAALPCLGHPAPTTAPDPLVITGKVFAIDH